MLHVKMHNDCEFEVFLEDGFVVYVSRRDRQSEWFFVSPQGHDVYQMDFAQVLVHLSIPDDEGEEITIRLGVGIKGMVA